MVDGEGRRGREGGRGGGREGGRKGGKTETLSYQSLYMFNHNNFILQSRIAAPQILPCTTPLQGYN